MPDYPTATPGVLTSLNSGAYNATGGTGERILVDYKDAIMDYKVTDLPVMQYFAEPMSTDTGGNIDITFAQPSMKLEMIDEGNTPQYQHTKLRSERVSVKEWGIATAVTRRMIEDSRFNEVEMALTEARRAVDRHMTEHVVKVIFGGAADTTFGTYAIDADTSEANLSNFSNNVYGGFFGSGMAAGDINAAGHRLVSYANESSARLIRGGYFNAVGGAGAGEFALADVAKGIDRIATHGFNASHLFISPAHYHHLLKIGDFVTAFTAGAGGEAGDAANPTTTLNNPANPFNKTAATGKVGSLYGLDVITSAWVPSDRIGMFDLSVKPMVYVERRPLTVEEANPGFGIVGSYMSMRYGLKVVRPSVGTICINA